MKNTKRRIFMKGIVKLSIAGLVLSTFSNLALAQNNIKEKIMKLTQKAREKFEKLFGKAEDTPLAKSDPEFFESYVNFAFDEVQNHTSLKENEQFLVILAALVGVGRLSEFKIILQAALKNGLKPVEIKEMLYQSSPYMGMGKVLDFINASNEIFKQNGIKLPLEPQGRVNRDNRQEKGLEVQRKLFGSGIDKANASVSDDEKHIRAFLSAHCFGDFYTRGGLELKLRELLTFVFVLSIGGADSQVKAHVQGNINIGNDRKVLLATITALIPYIGYPRSLNALAAVNELAKA